MKKQVFIGIIIVILILLVILGILVSFKINKLNEENYVTNNEIVDNISDNQETGLVKENNLFYTIEACIQNYETILHINYEEQLNELNQPSVAAVYGITSQEEKTSAILDILDSEFVDKYNINSSNVITILGQYINEVEVRALDVLRLKSDNTNVGAYAVSADIVDDKNNKKETELFIVKLDSTNTTFSIYPIINNEYNNINEINTENKTKQIEKNNNNMYVLLEYNDSQIATKYFQEYKELMLNNVEEAYNKLDEEYRNEKFENIEDFKKYISDKNINDAQIIKYQSQDYEGYKQYVSQKIDGTYWIIKEKSPRNYTVILDTYTIDLPEFTEKYNNATDAEKVLMNIQRVFDAINDKDYRYVYNKLDATFRQNNFPTEADFENYIKQNFYENNTIAYSNYKTSGDLHIYEISIKDKNNENNKEKTKTFIMQLKEGTDFVMSFNVQ